MPSFAPLELRSVLKTQGLQVAIQASAFSLPAMKFLITLVPQFQNSMLMEKQTYISTTIPLH